MRIHILFPIDASDVSLPYPIPHAQEYAITDVLYDGDDLSGRRGDGGTNSVRFTGGWGRPA